jgi:hypothetical protein
VQNEQTASPGPSTITYQRRKKVRDGAINDTGLHFGDDVPREIIAVKDPKIEAIPEGRRELIGNKVTYPGTTSRQLCGPGVYPAGL